MLSMKMNKRVIKLSASLMSLVMMCNTFIVDCVYSYNQNDTTEQGIKALFSELRNDLAKDKIEDSIKAKIKTKIEAKMKDEIKLLKGVSDRQRSQTKLKQYDSLINSLITSYIKNNKGYLDDLSGYLESLENMNVSYRDAAGVIKLIDDRYDNLINTVCANCVSFLKKNKRQYTSFR